MKRLAERMLQGFRPTLAGARDASPVDAADLVLPRFLAWRLRMLVLVVLLTALAAGIDAASRLAGEPQESTTFVLILEPESDPTAQSFLGNLADLVWDLSFYAMPTSCVIAATYWARPRVSRSILMVGWAAAFLVPVGIALLPWSLWELDPQTRQAPRMERIQQGVAWGVYYFVVLSPAVLALVPGIMRSCIRIKSLLPGSLLPGWLLVAAAPFNGLLALAVLVSLVQVAPSPLLLAGMLLWIAAPLCYMVRAGVYTRPIATADEVLSARRTRTVARAMTIVGVGCLLVYVATWEAFGVRLVGLDVDTSVFRPWQVVRYLLDFSSRSLFVSVLGADLLLQATISAWRQERAFTASPAAAESDLLMERMDAGTGTRVEGCS